MSLLKTLNWELTTVYPDNRKFADLTDNIVTGSGLQKVIDAVANKFTNYVPVSNIKTVATSGSYNDLSDKPTIPTKTSELTNNSNFATITLVNNAVSNLVNSAPDTLDTLKELADALNNDANFATTITASIAAKLDSTAISDWAKATTKPSYTATEVGADASGTASNLINALDYTYSGSGNYVTGVSLTDGKIAVTKGTLPTSLPASDVYAWAKATTKPSYSYSEISNTPDLTVYTKTSDLNYLSETEVSTYLTSVFG